MSTDRRYAVSAPLTIAVMLAAIGSISFGITPLTAQGTRVDAGTADRRLPSVAAAAPVLDDEWDTFSADVTLRRHLVSPAGEVSAEAPAVRYRWTRTLRARGWTSAIEITQLAPPRIRSANGQFALTEPAAVLRVEDDEDGSAPRVYDRHGRALRLPSTMDRQVLGEPVAGSLEVPKLPQLASPELRRAAAASREWAEAFIAPAANAAARRTALRRRYGRSPGRLRNLDRFLHENGRDTTEVLADTAHGVVLEVNLGRDGQLVARSEVGYAARADGTLVRRSVRTEQALAATANRAVSTMELANVRLARRGVR